MNAPSIRAIACGLETSQQKENANLHILYVNLLQRRKQVTREKLKRAVEDTFGSLQNVSYHVRYEFLLERAILTEIVQQDIDYVVLGNSRRGRWQRYIRHLLDLEPNLEAVLNKQVDVKVITAT